MRDMIIGHRYITLDLVSVLKVFRLFRDQVFLDGFSLQTLGVQSNVH